MIYRASNMVGMIAAFRLIVLALVLYAESEVGVY